MYYMEDGGMGPVAFAFTFFLLPKVLVEAKIIGTRL
jgi:hypothetical protein